MTRPFTAIACLLLAASGGCEVRSKLFCEKNPTNPQCTGNGDGGAIDTPVTGCTSSTQCSAPTAACDTMTSTCVACFQDNSTCTGSDAPICGSDNACHGCGSNADCTVSNTCLDSGACADAATVAYVESSGSGSDCSLAAPCADAVTALATQRPIVRLIGASSSTLLAIERSVTFIGDPGSSVLTGTNNATFQLGSGALVLENFTLTNSTVTTSKGIGVEIDASADGSASLTIEGCTLRNHGAQAILASAGTVTISRSLFSDNTDGAMVLGSSTGAIVFSVTNNFIIHNGSFFFGNTTGGANLHPGPGSVFEFNTVMYNFEGNAPTGPDASGGVVCTGGLTMNDNIIAGSTADGDNGSDANLVGNCSPGNSILAAASSIPGFHFVDDTGSDGDYHLTAQSTDLIDHAVGSANKIDFDGQPRPNGSASDIGADELYPTE